MESRTTDNRGRSDTCNSLDIADPSPEQAGLSIRRRLGRANSTGSRQPASLSHREYRDVTRAPRQAEHRVDAGEL